MVTPTLNVIAEAIIIISLIEARVGPLGLVVRLTVIKAKTRPGIGRSDMRARITTSSVH